MAIWSWFTRRRLDLDEDDFREEIRAHLAIAVEEQVDAGLEPNEARYAALREFGNVTRTTEAARRIWTPPWIENLRDQLTDVRYALRTLAKNPGFTLTVVAVLTLGIGLNAAVFTMLKSMALSPIAGVTRAADIAVIFAETAAGRPVRLSYPDYRYLRDHDRAFTGLFGTAVGTTILGRGRGARQIWTEFVTGNYFEVLAVQAQLGRTLLPADEVAPGGHPVVVISDGLWRRDLNADPAIVGKTLEINNTVFTIVGVAAPGFHGTTVVYDVEAYVSVMMAPQLGFRFGSDHQTAAGVLGDQDAAVLLPRGYLRPGVSLESAATQASALWSSRPVTRSDADARERVRVVPFRQTPNGAPSYVLPSLGVMTGMGLLVLAIACANIAGLVLVRGVSRRGEIAVRLALGATRRRIVRLLVIENLVLALPGAVFGVLLARQLMPVLVSYADWLAAPQRLFFNVQLDAWVVAFATVAACGSALVFGFLPALRSSRVDLVSTINEDASPRGAARARFRSLLVVTQVAVSLLLLVGAGLAARSVRAAREANPGFDAREVASITLDVRQNGYDAARGRTFYRALLDAVRADPAVESASVAVNTPMNMTDTRAQNVAIDGYVKQPGEDLAFMFNIISSEYFRTLRVPVLAGRDFDARDDEQGAPVLVVNETLAKRFWGGASTAVGKRIRIGATDWRTIVGVAADLKYSRIDEPARPYFYLPLGQSYRSEMVLHVRGRAMDHVFTTVREQVSRLDPDLTIIAARPMSESIRGALIFFDLTATMLFLFGLTGMTLAALGTYGLVAYTVRQSSHEIGIRMALGASRASVVRAFLSRGLQLGVVGALIGVVAALAVSTSLSRVLFGVSPTDAWTFARAAAVVLTGVAIASLVPAWRAARMNPLRTLRHQ